MSDKHKGRGPGAPSGAGERDGAERRPVDGGKPSWSEPTSWDETRLASRQPWEEADLGLESAASAGARAASAHDGDDGGDHDGYPGYDDDLDEGGDGDAVGAHQLAAEPLDALLRSSMRALEAQAPAGYFDALPAQIDARLDGAMMVSGSSGAIAIGALAGSTTAELEDEPPRGAHGRLAHAEGSRGPAGRAPRRASLSTEVVGPHPWWHSRTAAVGLGAAALAAALVLVVVVLRRDPAERQPLPMGASSMRDPGSIRATSGRRPPEEEPDAAELERRAVRAELAPLLPSARACLGARPAEPISLELTVSATGEIRDVLVRGPLPETSAARCITEAIQRASNGGKLPPRARAQTVRVPLFD